MKKIKFAKMVASGNDFVVIHHPPSTIQHPNVLARLLCDRKYGVGADGLLLLEKSKKADVKMRIFNADGSEAEMCGNGARCAALYNAQIARGSKSQIIIETMAGIIQAYVNGSNVEIRLTDPKKMELDIPVRVNNRALRVNFINTGVPHTVILVEGVEKIDIKNLGRSIRYHQRFLPAGTNVDFVEILSSDAIRVRTYERGVEDETLACGTGAVASVLISTIHYPCLSGRQALSTIRGDCMVNVITKSGEVLKVYFKREGNSFSNIWLEGKARIAYKGEYYV